MSRIYHTTFMLQRLAWAAAMAALASQSLHAQMTVSQYPGWVGQDVGAPQLPGSVAVANTNIAGITYSNAIFITGGGHDIWDSSDDFFYFFTNKTHGFDARVQVLNLVQPSSSWAKAELMVRSPQDPSNPVPDGADPEVNNMTTTTAGQNGVMDQWRATRGGGSSWPGSFTALNSTAFAPQYPNCWLRLQRQGDVFISSASRDGTNWTLLDRYDSSANPLGDKLLVGLAVTSHDQATTANAVFANLQFVNPPPDILAILPRNHSSYLSPNTNLTFTVSSVSGINATGISLVVNGVDQTAKLQISGSATSQNVTYAGPFQTNMFYNFTVKAVDVTGATATTSFSWDTLADTNFTIEGEDFNFNGGKYIDNIILSSTAGPNNYINTAGVQGIDENDPSENGANHAYRTYDATSMTGERVGTEPNGDVVRSKFLKAQQTDAAIVDYDVGWVDLGEWYNYTRTFPQGKYQVYARLAYPGGALAARLDLVTSSASAPNQSTAFLGTFAGPGTGGWQTYAFYPLNDYQGNPVVLTLSGVNTVRFTTTAGGLNVNFLMFVPYTGTNTLTPLVTGITPLPNATGVNPGVIISATIVNRDTSASANGAKLTVNGADVTAAAKITSFAGGAIVTYAPPSLYAWGSTNTATLVFSDNASPPNWQTNQWSFVVRSTAPSFTLPGTLAVPASQIDTTKGGFIWDMSQVSSTGNDAQNSTQRTLDQLAGLLGDNIADPNAQGVASGPGMPGATTAAPIRFIIPGLIEVDRHSATWGNWGSQAGGDQMPGSPGTAGGTDNQAARAVTYIYLPAGVTRMGVNSDDGFLTEAGNYDDVFSLTRMPGAEFNGGRGYADTTWSFVVTNAGYYPFVTYWENGGGDSRVVWFTYTADGRQVAVNDMAGGGQPSFYALVAGSSKAKVTSVTPAIGATGALPNTTVRFTLADGSTPIDSSTVSLKLDGAAVAATVTKANGVTTVVFQPGVFASASSHSATLSYTENGMVITHTWSFTVLAYPVQTMAAGALKNSAGTYDVGITFDRMVQAASATNKANYTLTGGTITQAVLVTNVPNYGISAYQYQAVVLTASGLTAGSQYTVGVNNVLDTQGNKISTNLTFTVSSMAWGEVGADQMALGNPGGYSVVGVGTNGFDLFSDGIAEWNNYDESTFVYEQISGDFDKKLRVEYQDLSSEWARAGLAMREVTNFGVDAPTQTGDPGGNSSNSPTAPYTGKAGRYQKVHVNPQGPTLTGPGTGGNNAWETNRRLDIGGGSSNAGNNNDTFPLYPNAWVRMQRIGQQFNVFRSDDGLMWTWLGTTLWPDANDQSATAPGAPMPNTVYVGPEFSPENGNITDTASRGRWLAALRDYGDTWPQIVPVAQRNYSIGLKFGADEPSGSNGSTLAPTDQAGVPGIKQKNWNNLTGASGSGSTLVADVNGNAVSTSLSVTWSSPNTWSSQGRGETNSAFSGPDEALMLGYLDTGAPSTTTVTINNIATNLTAGGYDVYVYIMGGVGTRGGAYRITDPGTGNVIKDYVFAVIATYPTNFFPVPASTSPTNYGSGDYIVFSGLTAADIQVEATTDHGYGVQLNRSGATPRAPIAAIQLVAPTAGVPTPNIKLAVAKSGGNLTISWSPAGGTLQTTPSLSGTPTWTAVGTANPATIPIGSGNAFYRVKSP